MTNLAMNGIRAAILTGTALAAVPIHAQTVPPEEEASGASSVATTPQPSPNSAPSSTIPAQSPTASPAAGADTGAAEPTEILVTARRRDEALQDVPVSVSAFSAAALERSTVQTIADVRTISPGLTFSVEGGKNNTAVTLRGIGQIPTGEVTPGVVTYVANVPLPSIGSNVPTYDIASIQVLKGPQGTLFGRNTLGGAILIGPEEPQWDLGGYVQGTYGNYDYRAVEGAINVPIVEDVLSVRAAGQIRRRDPMIYSINGDNDFNNIHQDSFRISALVTPTDWLESKTIYEYFDLDESSSGFYLLRQNFSMGAFFGPEIGQYLDNQIEGYLQQQQDNFYGVLEDSSLNGFSRVKSQSIVNDTSAEFGAFTVRNIFGYRKNESSQLINAAATGPTLLPGAAFGSPVDVPLTIFHAAQQLERQYLTEEFQFLGDFDTFNFIVGGFYNEDKPSGPSGSTFEAFTTPGTPASVVTAHVRNENYALFAQVNYELTDTLNATAGFRYSWDKVSACGGAVPGGLYVSDSECREVAATGAADGVGTVSNKGEEPSWTVGLDWRATPDLLLYIVTRRGYRGVNVNTPAFETRFTTGGMDPACGFGTGQCPDLRQFQTTGEETLTDVEVGEKFDFRFGGGRGRVNTAVFYSEYKDALQFLNVQAIVPANAPDNPTNASIGVNAADLTIWGIELETSVSPSRDLTISFNGAYTDVSVDSVNIPQVPGLELTEDQVNTYSPKLSGTLSASWTLPITPLDGEVMLNGDLFVTDDFGGQNGEKLPGYELVNARIDWKAIGGTGLDLGFFVRNLTKERYFASANVLLPSFPVSSVVVGDPRTYGVTASYRF